MNNHLARDKWRSSGIKDEFAKTLGLRELSAEETCALGANFQKVRSLFIPYFDLSCKQTNFFRLRYLEPLPGFAGQARKPQKYAQAVGTLNEVYFPPIFDWAAIAEDSRIEFFITEGELKAASACQVELPCIGLGGVDVWRSAKRGLEMFPVLDQIKWSARKVTIVYDSDAAVNPNVVRAQNQLARALTARGANPLIASLPPTSDGDKQGLDDFLVRYGKEELLKQLDKATDFPEATALWELNEDVVYVRDPGLVVVRNTGQRIAPGAFIHHAYANRHYTEIQHTKKGPVMAKKPLAPRWLQWEHRFELEKMTYKPGQPQMTELGEWNSWIGWGCEPKQGDIAPWKWLINFLFGEEDFAWFEKWCAYPLQHPGAKLFSSVVMWGRHHGTGKTLIAYTLGRIYGRNFGEIKNKDLISGFNEWAIDKQFVYGDEIVSGHARIDADWLKGVITQEFLTINAKYIPTYVIPDCVNYFFSSNSPNAFFLEDTDRRFFVHEVISAPAARELYAEYDKWLRGPGPSYLFAYLLNLDLTGFNPMEAAPLTESKSRMMYDAKSDIGAWCVNLREDPTMILHPLGDNIASACDLFTPTQLHRCFDPERRTNVTVNGLSRELRKAGFLQVNHGIPVGTSTGVQRLYAIRNENYWMTAAPKLCAEHFDKFWGLKTQRF